MEGLGPRELGERGQGGVVRQSDRVVVVGGGQDVVVVGEGDEGVVGGGETLHTVAVI